MQFFPCLPAHIFGALTILFFSQCHLRGREKRPGKATSAYVVQHFLFKTDYLIDKQVQLKKELVRKRYTHVRAMFTHEDKGVCAKEIPVLKIHEGRK